MNQETEKVSDVKQRPRKAPIEIYRIGAFKNRPIKTGLNSNQPINESNNEKVENLTKNSKISLSIPVSKDSILTTDTRANIVGKDNSKTKLEDKHRPIKNYIARSKSEDKVLEKVQELKNIQSKKNLNINHRPRPNMKDITEIVPDQLILKKNENNKQINSVTPVSRSNKEVYDPLKNRVVSSYKVNSAEDIDSQDCFIKRKLRCKSPKPKDFNSDYFHGSRTFNNTSRSQVKPTHLVNKDSVEQIFGRENEKYSQNKPLQKTSNKQRGFKGYHLEKECNDIELEVLHKIDKSVNLETEPSKRKSISKILPIKQVSAKNFTDCRTSLERVDVTSNSGFTNRQTAKPDKLIEVNTKDFNNGNNTSTKTKSKYEKTTEAKSKQNYQSIKSTKGPKVSLNTNNDSQGKCDDNSQKINNSNLTKKNIFKEEKHDFTNFRDEFDSQSKNNVEPENCFTGPTKELEVSKFIECMKLDASTDETGSHDSDFDEDVTIDNPMTYIDFQDSSFNKTSSSNSVSTSYKRELNSMKCNNSKNICWGDEKWSPAQRQRKNPGKSRKKDKESFAPESPGRRGIIQINNSNAHSQHESSSNAANIHPIGQKMLFNPNNPSKPVAVTPSARDMPPTWDNCNSEDKNGDENTNAEHDLIDTSFESGSKIDPSIFYGIQKGELDINYYVSSNQIPQEFRRIMDIRKHLQNCYSQLLITDIRLCQEKNIESALWKSLYYVIIEKLREYITREPSLKDRSLSTLLMLVEDGLEYLQKLVKDLQKAYGFSLDSNFEEDLMTVPGTKNRVRLALFSCQKILLCMGDLARYKEQYNQTPNYNSAKTWYEKALQVHPRNGRPFNQLAIIAVSQKRPLDVVYYYIRSLTAANPFTSARDSLISMFEDIRRKYEGMEKISSNPKLKIVSIQPEELNQRDTYGSLRQEIWIRPDSGATHKRTLTQSDHEEERNARIIELLQLPPDQLMKHFLTGFLHCHGMLFSRVGLDHFMDVLVNTLNLFQVLLKLSPPRLSPTHLLQIMAVNMFAVDNTQLRDTRIESGYRSAAQDLALLLSQEMFARLAEAMVSLFPKNFNYPPVSGSAAPKHKSKGAHYKDKNSSDKNSSFSEITERVWDGQGLFMPQLAHFVPAAKVWCDWLLYQSSIWNPPPVLHDLQLGLDTWGVIGELATIVKGIGPPDLSITEEGPSQNLVAVILPEDSFLKGYTPLLAAHRSSYFVPKGSPLERARDWVRICKFQLCLSQFLCGVEPPVLRLQKTDQGEILVPIVAETPPDSPSIRPNRDSISSSDVDVDDSISDFDSSDEDDLDKSIVMEDDTPLASTVRLLAIRKKMLEKKQRQQRKMQALLEGSITLEIEVRPRYLVPDTNCFIEHLDVIKALINFKNNAYTMMVPLVVLNELDGLSRDAAVEKYGDAHHAVNVREGAAAALHYVKSTKHAQLKCVTSQGSILPSTMFTSEIDSQQDVTNDDKILSCCLQYCGDTHQRRVIKKGVRRLYREVVLLTEDRNLRVKAYSRDVPVRDLLDFAHWAGIK